jgi:mRNA interferase RelE/StbE
LTSTILYHERAAEDLRDLDTSVCDRILRAIENRLHPAPESAGKPLRGKLKNVRSFRVGDWRVLYALRGREIWILRIGHRKEAYGATVPAPGNRSPVK